MIILEYRQNTNYTAEALGSLDKNNINTDDSSENGPM